NDQIDGLSNCGKRRESRNAADLLGMGIHGVDRAAKSAAHEILHDGPADAVLAPRRSHDGHGAWLEEDTDAFPRGEALSLDARFDQGLRLGRGEDDLAHALLVRLL